MMKTKILKGLLVGLFMLPACAKKQTIQIEDGQITKENLSAIVSVLKADGLSNLDVFENWVNVSQEDELDDSGFRDADCRMTVMLLAGDALQSQSVNEEYTGNYLMFDLDIIENQQEYQILKPKENLFTTIFGETPITDKAIEELYPEVWHIHGITFTNPKVFIISIVFTTFEGDAIFVGHTGILAQYNDGYIFVEKIAFGDPFVVSVVKKPEDLIDLFSSREDYQVLEGDTTPLVYQNAVLLGALKQ